MKTAQKKTNSKQKQPKAGIGKSEFALAAAEKSADPSIQADAEKWRLEQARRLILSAVVFPALHEIKRRYPGQPRLDKVWTAVYEAERELAADDIRAAECGDAAALVRCEQRAEHEDELAHALASFTDPTSAEYDPEFDRQIREIRPDWFE